MRFCIRPVNRAFVLLATMDIRAAEGIVVVDEPENVVNQKMIIELTEKNRLPAIVGLVRSVARALSQKRLGVPVPLRAR